MTAKIIPFPNPKVDRDVVKMLEHQLALAREGKIKFVAFAAVNDQNIGYSGWSPDDDINQELLTAALGAVGFLNARFFESASAGATDASNDDGPEVA